MTMSFTVYSRLTPAELDRAADDAKRDITKWFATNKRRRVCNAQLWYGRMYKINKSQIEKNIDAARRDADK